MNAHNTTRRNVLKGVAGLMAGGVMAGCTANADDARNDMSIIKHDTLPTRKQNWDPDLEMGVSGWKIYTREGSEAHTADIARLSPEGEWFLDVVDLCQFRGNGKPEREVRANELAEGGSVVFLAAHNDRGTVVSPDATENSDLNALLPD